MSEKEKVLVIGTGLLGSSLLNIGKEHSSSLELACADRLECPGITCPSYSLDLVDRSSIEEVFRKTVPDLVILTAAMTNVDQCETDPGTAFKVNAQGPASVGQECKRRDCPLIFVSTDFVFDGVKGNYSEKDTPEPINEYGRSKLAGERSLEALDMDLAIVRTSVLYGAHTQTFNFGLWLYRELSSGNTVKIVTDQWASPTLASRLSQGLLRLWDRREFDLFHIAGAGRISRYDFALTLANKMGLNPSLIIPISSAELDQKAQRPQDSSLDVSKAEHVLGIDYMGLDDSLEDFRSQLEGKEKHVE